MKNNILTQSLFLLLCAALLQHSSLNTMQMTKCKQLTKRKKPQTDKKQYCCTTCNKILSTKSNLTAHERTHFGIGYTCTICNKRFTYPANLAVHIREHSGVKPYNCSTCNKSFSRKGNLAVHEQRHLKKKLYPCPSCKKSFDLESDLIKHKHTHSINKPYACTACPKRFIYRSSLFSHIWTHSTDKTTQTPNPSTCQPINHHTENSIISTSIYQPMNILFENELYEYEMS